MIFWYLPCEHQKNWEIWKNKSMLRDIFMFRLNFRVSNDKFKFKCNGPYLTTAHSFTRCFCVTERARKEPAYGRPKDHHALLHTNFCIVHNGPYINFTYPLFPQVNLIYVWVTVCTLLSWCKIEWNGHSYKQVKNMKSVKTTLNELNYSQIKSKSLKKRVIFPKRVKITATEWISLCWGTHRETSSKPSLVGGG